MNTKFKLSVLAGVLALAVAGQASAAPIVAGGTYDNNLVLSVWDQTNLTSYTANLGVTMQNMLTGAGLTFGGTSAAPIVTGADTAANNFTFADTALTSFLSTASANTSWSVIAANTNVLGYGTSGIFSTTTSTIVPGVVTAANITAMGGVNGNYIATVNSLWPATPANSITTTAAAGGAAYVGAAGNGMGNNFGGTFPYFDTAAIGQSQNFYFMTPTTNARGAFAGATVFEMANAAGVSAFTLGSNGTLSYSVAAIPEPSEWLLILSGFGLVGFIATRRKGQSSMAFA